MFDSNQDIYTQADDQGYYDEQDYWGFILNEYEPEAYEYEIENLEYSEQYL